MTKTGGIWLAFSLAVLLALSRSSATCAEGGDEANRQPNPDDLVRAILAGDDQQLLTVAAWFRVMRPEDVAAALRRLQDTLKVELLKARRPTGSASVSVRGTVVGEAGQLMHGKVCLKRIVTGSPRGAAREVFTELVRAGAVRVVDSDGDFEFAGVDPGYYSLTVCIDGLTYGAPTLLVAERPVVARISLGTGVVDMRLVGRDGNPVGPADVLAELPGHLWVEGTADVKGRLKLTMLPAGEWMVSAGDAYLLASEKRHVSVRPRAITPLQVLLVRQVILEVRVVDGEGRAVGNAMVRIVRKDLLGGAEVGGVTDSQGRYRASVSEGRWVVDVGGGRRVVPVEVSGAETQLVTIVQ